MPQKHLYLPKIITGANISEPVSNAVWEDKERQIITAISDAIEVDEAVTSKGVSSVPDIYARPLSFLGALRYEKHPLRARIIQEWRGLLSLMALHSVKPDLSKLRVTSVSLNDEKFSRALKNLAPKPVPLQKGVPYQWTDFIIIKFDDIPIGAFSPATLVYTSSDYNEKLKNLAGFALKDENGYLRPPGKTEGLDYVGKWLENFIRTFNKIANTDEGADKISEFTGNLNKLLDEWLKEIKVELGVPLNSNIGANRVIVAEEMPEYIRNNPPKFLSRYAIYQHILTPLVKASNESEGPKSEYSLLMARNRSKQAGTEYKEVVIINAQLLAQNRKLWDDTTPRELSDDTYSLIDKFFPEASGSLINNINIKNDNAIWVRPELYFLTTTLLKSKTDDDILNESGKFLNAEDTEFILPFKNEILHYFSPVDIQEILKPTFRKVEGKVIFSFQLPLVDNHSIEIKKTYSDRISKAEGEGEIIETEVPVLEIFPNYLGDFWCQYFMLCSNLDSFSINPLNFGRATQVTRKEQLIETNNSREKAEIIRMTGYDAFPEAINIAGTRGSKANYGIILLNKDSNVGRPFNGKVTVGIDLGTSNTNIYRYSNDNARRWQFKFSKYVRSVLNSDPQKPKTENFVKKELSKRDKITRAFFVPTQDQELPIPTLLRVFKAGITSDILLDQFIYFPHEPEYPNNVDADVKWAEDITVMLAFIKSTLFLILIDLLQDRTGNIEFRCTYPKSYPDEKIHNMKMGWTKILEDFIYRYKGDDTESLEGKFIWADNRKFNDENGVYTISTENNGKLIINTKPAFTTEGIAAGEYFSSELIITDGVNHANKVDGAVCIDVGGGTSDYSIWFDSEIKLDASVKLAGAQIAKLLKNNSRLRDLLLSEKAAFSLNEVRDDELLFSSRLNFVLREEEKQISSNLSNNAQNRDIAWVRRILAIEFGALAFYAGHLSLSLDEFLRFELSKRMKENSLKIHWGGNAAKFINWIDYGRYEDEGIASKFLNMIFGNTIFEKSIGERAFKPLKLKQVQSPAHKNEASGGISVMINVYDEKTYGHKPVAETEDNDFYFDQIDEEPADQELFAGRNTLQGITIGEQVSIGDQEYEHYSVIPKNGFFAENRSLFNHTTLKQLERYIFLVNQVGKVTGLFPEGSEISLTMDEKLAIKQRVKNTLAEQAKLKMDKREVEPVFILEVKYMLDILSHKMR